LEPVAADVEQDDLLVRDLNPEDDAVVVGDADRLNVLQFAAEMVVGKVERKRILLQVVHHLRKAFSQIGDRVAGAEDYSVLKSAAPNAAVCGMRSVTRSR
jgi:hypothetical protein